jgi:hypothetical protein
VPARAASKVTSARGTAGPRCRTTRLRTRCCARPRSAAGSRDRRRPRGRVERHDLASVPRDGVEPVEADLHRLHVEPEAGERLQRPGPAPRAPEQAVARGPREEEVAPPTRSGSSVTATAGAGIRSRARARGAVGASREPEPLDQIALGAIPVAQDRLLPAAGEREGARRRRERRRARGRRHRRRSGRRRGDGGHARARARATPRQRRRDAEQRRGACVAVRHGGVPQATASGRVSGRRGRANDGDHHGRAAYRRRKPRSTGGGGRRGPFARGAVLAPLLCRRSATIGDAR